MKSPRIPSESIEYNMPKRFKSKTFSKGKSYSQASENDFFFKTPTAAADSKITVTEENLLSIHIKIQMHLQGKKPLSKFEVQKLTLILNKMECSSPREYKIVEVAQNILSQIYKQMIETSSESQKLRASVCDSQYLSSSQISKQNGNSMTLHQANSSNIFGSLILPSLQAQSPVSTNQNINETVNTISTASSQVFREDVVVSTIEEPFDSQATNVLKLRFDDVMTEDGSLSFPLELLTNNDFLFTQTNADSGAIDENIQYIGKSLPSSSTNVELNTQNRNTLTFSENNMMNINPYNFELEATPKICCSKSSPEGNDPVQAVTKDIHSLITKLKRPIMTPQCPDLQQRFGLPSEGSLWQDGSLSETTVPSLQIATSMQSQNSKRISQATAYDFNEENLSEIISVDTGDTTLEDIVVDFEIADAENGVATDESSQNIINKMPMEINDVDFDVDSMVFNLESSESTVIEETPVTNRRGGIIVNAIKETTLPDVETFPKMSVVSEPEEIIIDETEYSHSESAIFKQYSRDVGKRGISSPYKNPTQSSSFLNYKSNGKSSRNLLLGRRGKRISKSGSNFATEALEPKGRPVQSENITVINGVIPKRPDRMNDSSPTGSDEESVSDKQNKLQEKVLKRRNSYRDKWKDMPISEKVSAKFAKKFHVRIFDDPVDSLTNIGYESNYSSSYFSKLTIKELHNQLQPCSEIAEKMNVALTKVVEDLVHNHDVDSAFNLPRSPTSDSDSDSSDDENRANKKWLKNYLVETKHEMREFVEKMRKELKEDEADRKSRRERYEPQEHDDNDESLVNILRKMSECNWLKD